jgi:hypothetical protein
MAGTDLFFIPTAPARERPPANSARKRSAGGVRFGVLDNGKSNADHLLGMLVEHVRANFAVSSVVWLRKPSAAAGAEPAMLERLATEADFVVSAMAD